MNKTPRTVVIDPPWSYPEGFNGFGKRRPLPYKSLTKEEIARLPIGSLVAEEGYVFLWTTNRHIAGAFDILRAWGLTYKQTVVWCKPDVGGLGGMFGTNLEFVLISQRINPGTHAHSSRTKRDRITTSWFQWPVGEHSEKPDEFYRLVERVAQGPYMDVFARRAREGWASVGDAIDGRDIRDLRGIL